MQGARLVGHEQILFLKGVQVLQSRADVFQDSVTLLLVAVQLVSGVPGGEGGNDTISYIGSRSESRRLNAAFIVGGNTEAL